MSRNPADTFFINLNLNSSCLCSQDDCGEKDCKALDVLVRFAASAAKVSDRADVEPIFRFIFQKNLKIITHIAFNCFKIKKLLICFCSINSKVVCFPILFEESTASRSYSYFYEIEESILFEVGSTRTLNFYAKLQRRRYRYVSSQVIKGILHAWFLYLKRFIYNQMWFLLRNQKTDTLKGNKCDNNLINRLNLRSINGSPKSSNVLFEHNTTQRSRTFAWQL